MSLPPDPAEHWQYWPQCWYVVARSRDLHPGQVLGGQLDGHAWVLYRTGAGCLKAADAFCPHMGAHLGAATVQGDDLLCALHARPVSPVASPACPAAGRQGCLPTRAWPVHEHSGLIWLHPPAATVPPPPFAASQNDYRWLSAGPERIDADWRAMICNGFDLAHMQVVHQRTVVGTPAFTRTAEGCLKMDYRTRVLAGGGLSSWLTRRLAGGDLQLIHTCAGSSIMVQSQIGRFRSCGIFALLPQQTAATAPEARHTLAFAAIGIPHGAPLIRSQLHLARMLYLAFLRKDFGVVEHMRLRLAGVDDPGVIAVAAYQASLKPLSIDPSASA